MDSKFKSFIVSLLRKGTQRWPPVQQALNEVKEVYYITSKKGKQLRRVKFTCAHCKKQFKRTQISVDHINPVVDPIKGFINWDEYITRMYPPKEGFQILCDECHDKKSKLERELRKKYKKANKIIDNKENS